MAYRALFQSHTHRGKRVFPTLTPLSTPRIPISSLKVNSVILSQKSPQMKWKYLLTFSHINTTDQTLGNAETEKVRQLLLRYSVLCLLSKQFSNPLLKCLIISHLAQNIAAVWNMYVCTFFKSHLSERVFPRFSTTKSFLKT